MKNCNDNTRGVSGRRYRARHGGGIGANRCAPGRALVLDGRLPGYPASSDPGLKSRPVCRVRRSGGRALGAALVALARSILLARRTKTWKPILLILTRLVSSGALIYLAVPGDLGAELPSSRNERAPGARPQPGFATSDSRTRPDVGGSTESPASSRLTLKDGERLRGASAGCRTHTSRSWPDSRTLLPQHPDG